MTTHGKDMCKCGHIREEHNNKTNPSGYWAGMRYGTCIYKVGVNLCSCKRFERVR